MCTYDAISEKSGCVIPYIDFIITACADQRARAKFLQCIYCIGMTLAYVYGILIAKRNERNVVCIPVSRYCVINVAKFHILTDVSAEPLASNAPLLITLREYTELECPVK